MNNASGQRFDPRFGTASERNQRARIEFNHVRGCSTGVAGSLNHLDGSERGNTHLDRFSGRTARQFLQNPPDCERRRRSVGVPLRHRDDGNAAVGVGDARKWHGFTLAGRR